MDRGEMDFVKNPDNGGVNRQKGFRGRHHRVRADDVKDVFAGSGVAFRVYGDKRTSIRLGAFVERLDDDEPHPVQ